MLRIEKSDAVIGARLDGIDLRRPLDAESWEAIATCFAQHGVIAISGQDLGLAEIVAFGSRFGQIYENPTSTFKHPDFPEVMILSNRTENGKPVGIARQGWHTDMSYNAVPGKATLLHGIEIPLRDGKPLGDTLFCSMHAVHDALPAPLRAWIETLRAEHDFSLFYDRMIRDKASGRPPLTPEQRRKRPPVPHPMVGRHPATRRPFLYADPGYTTRILGIPEPESAALLEELFAFQRQERFQYRHSWRQGDVLIWDNWVHDP